MNKGLAAVLMILVVVACFVLIPRILTNPPVPPAETEADPVSADTQLACVHCGATFAAKDTRPMPNNQAMLLCPACNKPTPRRRAAQGN